MTLTTYHTMRKSYIYNFFPLKEDEERSVANSTTFRPRLHRELVEIRDVHAPPEIDPLHPWKIKKTLNRYEITSGKIIVSSQDVFEHILRYWNFFMTKRFTMFGCKVSVILWDVTNQRNPRKYEGDHIFLQMTSSEDCLLTCLDMMKDRNLKAGDNIGLYWEPRESIFRIKLLSSTGR